MKVGQFIMLDGLNDFGLGLKFTGMDGGTNLFVGQAEKISCTIIGMETCPTTVQWTDIICIIPLVSKSIV